MSAIRGRLILTPSCEWKNEVVDARAGTSPPVAAGSNSQIRIEVDQFSQLKGVLASKKVQIALVFNLSIYFI